MANQHIGSETRRILLAVGLFTTAVLLVFANTLYNDFHLDDYGRIVNNSEINRVAPIGRHFIDPSTSSVTRGIRVYGATLLPFGGSFYDTPEREAARRTVNSWIRSAGAFHGVIDFDAALRDPERPERLLPEADTGDNLHPNEWGYRRMAAAVNLDLFTGP